MIPSANCNSSTPFLYGNRPKPFPIFCKAKQYHQHEAFPRSMIFPPPKTFKLSYKQTSFHFHLALFILTRFFIGQGWVDLGRGAQTHHFNFSGPSTQFFIILSASDCLRGPEDSFLPRWNLLFVEQGTTGPKDVDLGRMYISADGCRPRSKVHLGR